MYIYILVAVYQYVYVRVICITYINLYVTRIKFSTKYITCFYSICLKIYNKLVKVILNGSSIYLQLLMLNNIIIKMYYKNVIDKAPKGRVQCSGVCTKGFSLSRLQCVRVRLLIAINSLIYLLYHLLEPGIRGACKGHHLKML